MNRRTLALALAALVAAASLTLLACGGGSPAIEPAAAQEPAQEPAPLPADVAQVAAELEKSRAEKPAEPAVPTQPPAADSGVIEATGEFVSPVRSELVVRTPGRVALIRADEGDRVRRGQPLLELETQYLKPELERAEAELARAEAAAVEAKADFERKQLLLDKGAIPQSLYDRSKGADSQARAAVEAAAAAVALARQKLADAVLTAPIDGVVAERRADVGERLGDNTVAYVLVQVAPLKLRFELPERYLPRVAKGQSVVAQVDPFPGQEFAGKVAMVGSVVNAASRTVPVEAEFANRDGRLRPGMFARVELAAEPGGSR